MNRLFSAKSLAIAAVAAGALAAASAAQARDNVSLSIGFNVPGAYVQPAPVYTQPAPVYYQPAPVYYEPAPVYVAPRPYYVQPAPVYYYGSRWHGHHGHRNGAWGDADRDGVPNRYDRAPNNPYRR